MAKSNKVRQKEFRDRKKQTNREEWLNSENDRVKKYYRNRPKLSNEELKARREKNRLRMKKKRQTKKDETITSNLTSGKTLSKNHSRKRISRAIAKTNRKLEQMQSKITQLQRRNWVLEKRLRRWATKKDMTNSHSSLSVPNTPRSITKAQLKQDGIHTESLSKRLKKKLELYNCMIHAIRNASKMQKNQIADTINAILRKYRGVRTLGTEIKMDRRTLKKSRLTTRRTRLPLKMKEIKNKIQMFLSRDDNSRCLPGKQDAKNIDGTKVQKRVLNDYLSNLWQKFRSENPETVVSLAVFCKNRPKNISLTSFINRRKCLCIYHQNMALKLKVIYKTSYPNPDFTFRNNTNDMIKDAMEKSLTEDTVKYFVWKRQTTPDGKTNTVCVEEVTTKEEFVRTMERDMGNFREHIKRVTTQYQQVAKLKENLKSDHVIIHMDFAENYNCKNLDEVQGAYWNSQQISLHPTVLYYRDNSGNLMHKSNVFISDDLSHNSSSVLCIMKKLIPIVKETVPNVKCVHFITDSPTSQYRNRNMMFVIANFEDLFDIPSSTWTYLEVGHGKGPCDGVGGITKRNADAAVNQGKTVIQNAQDFCNWGLTVKDTMVNYVLYDTTEVLACKAYFDKCNPLPVKHTLQVHAVCSKRAGEVTVRPTSCFCEQCYVNGLMICGCDGWITQWIGLTTSATTEMQTVTTMTICSITEDGSDTSIRSVIRNGILIAVYTDDLGEDFYLLKARAAPEVLQQSETDSWGFTLNTGVEIVRGSYYERHSTLTFKLIPRRLAIVPLQSVVYVVPTVNATQLISLPENIYNDIKQMTNSVAHNEQ